MFGSQTDFSRHGDTAAFVCQDLSTKWIAGYPANTKSAPDTVNALQHIIGQSKVQRLYSDGSGELEAASLKLEIPHDVSTPHRPQNNGVAERAFRRVFEGTRC